MEVSTASLLARKCLLGTFLLTLGCFGPQVLAQPAPVGVFGPSIPFLPGLPNGSGVLLDDGSVLLTGGASTGYRFDPITNTFQTTQASATIHANAFPALLPDGRVLLASGGQISTDRSAEIYNLATDQWTPTGPAITARHFPLTLTDANGRVFLLGGRGANGQNLASVERYDPATGQFVAAGSLLSARGQAGGVRLADGRFLIAGGVDQNNIVLRSSEIFDPATGTSTAAGNLYFATYSLNLILLQDTRVLMTGGWHFPGTGARISSTAELFDVATRQFTRIGPMTSSRYGHTTTLLPNGEVLIAGGQNDFAQILSSTGIFDPTAETPSNFRPGPSMPNPHYAPVTLALNDGSILFAGGGASTNPNGSINVSEWAERMRPDTLLRSGFDPL